MREPLFTPSNSQGLRNIDTSNPESVAQARLAAALHRAINLSIESAFSYGIDFPVGAVALMGSEISGRGFANDKRFGQEHLHAEIIALLDSRFSFGRIASTPLADTVVVSLEPCIPCQEQLAQVPGLKQVAFGLSRSDLAERGLVKPHEDDIFTRSKISGLQYEVTQVEDADLRTAGLTIFDHVTRNPEDGIVAVDAAALSSALEQLNNAGRG